MDAVQVEALILIISDGNMEEMVWQLYNGYTNMHTFHKDMEHF